jgi:ribose transport system substrate-binding protein
LAAGGGCRTLAALRSESFSAESAIAMPPVRKEKRLKIHSLLRRRAFLGAVATTVISISLLASGCNKSDSGSTAAGKTLKLAFVTNNVSDFWKSAIAGVHAYEKEAGVKVDIFQPTNGKVEEQNQILENLISQGYDGIAVSVIAPKDQVAEVNRAAKKTKVITFDSDADKSDRLCYIGTDNVVAGKTLGDEIVKLLPNGGKMAVFVGTFSADNAAARLQGIQQITDAHKIEIVAKKEDNTDRNVARTNVENVINAYSDINLLCGLWSYNGPQIAKALDASGKKSKVQGAVFDDEDGTLMAIESGTINCTVVQKPYQFGYQSSKMLHELNTKGASVVPASKKIDTGVRVINKDNLADYKAEMAKLKGS